MARVINQKNLAPIINAGQQWINKCLVEDNSILSQESLWTLENIAELKSAYVDHPDTTNDKFISKLRRQLANASPISKRLASETLWAALLFPSNVKAVTKRQQIQEIWSLSGSELPQTNPMLSDIVLGGIGSGGMGFNANRWRELAFLIRSAQDIKGKPLSERQKIISDYDSFLGWIDTITDDGDRQFKHMLRFFAFPDRVERMSSNRDRRDILDAFEVARKTETQNWNDAQLDRALFDLRSQLQQTFNGQILDFYESPLRERWKDNRPDSMEMQADGLPQETGAESADEFLEESNESMELDKLIPALKEGVDAASLLATNQQLLRFASSLESKRFLIVTGLAGSGKTKLAQAFARWITPARLAPDPFAPGSKIPSDRTTYFVSKSDDLSVEFWNSPKEAEAIKVTLPREIIAEWATYIRRNSLPETATAREIREAVKQTSRFSDQLHSFETHLKSAAFALLKSRTNAVNDACYSLIPVGADWTSSENVLGYPDGLRPPAGKKGNSEFVEGVYLTKPALDMIVHAKAHKSIPHFLILDEMNLSHVERYFADLLSMIESNESITLYCDEKGSNGQPKNTRGLDPVLSLPPNLFIVGTVNVDETTYMFSPKVLDRANVIEFRITDNEMASFLAEPKSPNLSLLDGKGAAFGGAFVGAANNPHANVPAEVKGRFEAEMKIFFAVLREHGAEFGYRVTHEAARFVHFYKSFGNGKIWVPEAEADKGAWKPHDEEKRDWFDHAFDCIIVQKFLPKLHGSKVKLGSLLKKVYVLCLEPHMDDPRNVKAVTDSFKDQKDNNPLKEPSRENPKNVRYPLTADKISRMWRQLNENGFTSFPEN